MENNNYTVEDRLIKYNNSVFRNNIKVGFANLKIKNAGALHNLKNKILTPFCGNESIEAKSASERYKTYQENYLNKLGGKKGVANLTHNDSRGKDLVTESILLMHNEIPYLVSKTTKVFYDPEHPNIYSEKVIRTYRGLMTTKFGRFQYFDIERTDHTLFYFDKSVSSFANFKVYTDISSTKLILGKKHFRATYDNQLSSKTNYFEANKDTCLQAYNSEVGLNGKIESVKNSLKKQFESTLVKAEDVEITNMLEQLIAKELNRNSTTLETNNNLSSIINPEK